MIKSFADKKTKEIFAGRPVKNIHPDLQTKTLRRLRYINAAESLDDLEIKPGALAKNIGVDRSAIKNIIEGNRSISAEMSIRLGLFFGMNDNFWLNLQKDYDMRIARQNRLEEFTAIVKPLSSLG